MADGPYRFQPGGGHHYYQQYAHQVHQPRHLTRSGSPVNNGRPNFSNDTPSPSRSPVSQAANHNSYVFNQGHQQVLHGMMNGNGASGHQRYMQMTNHAKFQHQTHPQQHHPHQNQFQPNHGTHPGQTGINHQHTFSGGLLSSTPASFNARNMANGTPADVAEELNEETTEYWQHQLQQHADSRKTAHADHHHSKKHTAEFRVRDSARSVETSSKDSNPEETNVSQQGAMTQWDGADLSGTGLRSLSPAMFFHMDFLTRLYIDGNKIKFLPPQIRNLRNLVHLDASQNELMAIPESIGMLTNLQELRLFDNHIQKLPQQLRYLFKLEFLGIHGNPLNSEQKALMVREGTKGFVAHLREIAEEPLPPKEREIIVLDDSDAKETVTVFDHNILCEKYATATHHTSTPARALSWDYRRQLILNELRKRQADVMCLQEIDQETFEDFCSELKDTHSGVHWQKRRARIFKEHEARFVDGCAIFYNNHKYVLLEKELIDFAQSAIHRNDVKGPEMHDIFNRVMPRDDIAVATLLENRKTGTRLIVSNTHIFWNTAFPDVKIVQVALMMEQIASFADKWARRKPCRSSEKKRQSSTTDASSMEESEIDEIGPSVEYSSGTQIPLIMCGDLNVQRHSAVYELLESGFLKGDHPDLANRKYGIFTRDGMTHPFKLKSAYDDQMGFTNYVPTFCGILDYVWYSTNTLRVRKLLGPIDEDYIEKVPGFPDFHFPSDHISLFVELAVETRKERRVVEADFGPQRER